MLERNALLASDLRLSPMSVSAHIFEYVWQGDPTVRELPE